MRAKAFNPQIFLESLCYCAFGALLFDLVRSGKYLSYVTPRMKPYLCFAAIVMGIWVLSGLARLFRPQHRIRSAHCFVLVLPVLLLLLPHSPLSSADLSGNYMNESSLSGQSLSGTTQKQSSSDFPGTSAATSAPTGIPSESSGDTTGSANGSSSVSGNGQASADTATPNTQTNTSTSHFSTELPGLDVANKKITVSNDDFGPWLSEICTNVHKYEGYTIIMTGYVFKDPQFIKSGEFVPARLMMTCCVADLAPSGLLCKYDKASELEENSWVTVEGTLFVTKAEYDGQTYDDPEITVTKVIPAEEVEGYIYPYY